MAIVKPESMNFSEKNIIMIIAGTPGVGKTTIALSAPDVMLIDADEGMARVNPAHRKDTAMCKTYEELLSDIQAAEGVYKTIVIDTGGALIDMLKDWAIRNDPKASKTSGGFSLQGFGIVKTEFLRLFAELRKKFNVVLLFHESKEKADEGITYELVCEGSARNLVWQPADLGAHMFIQNGERYLGFSPTSQYSAKAAYGIKGLVKVPELKDGEPNMFLTKLFAQVKAALIAESASTKQHQEDYEKAMETGRALIESVDAPEKALDVLNDIRKMAHALTSQKELEAAFKRKMADNDWTYSASEKRYVAKA